MTTHPLSTILGLAAAFAFSFALYEMSVPLAWLLGPLVMSGALSLSGLQIKPPALLRRIGQLTIGATVGLNITSTVLLHLLGWMPLMLLSAVFSVLASAVIAVLLGMWALIDTKSAFFASLPGGLAEMANVGAAVGADPEPIAVVQTVRVGLLVLAVPPLLIHFGISRDTDMLLLAPISLWWLPVLVVGGGVFAYLLGLLRLSNPWMVGATIWAAALTAMGSLSGSMPQLIFLAAQFFIGFAVGSQFRPYMIRRLPRVTFFGMITVGLLGLVMIGFSFLVATMSSIDVTTAILATSPGGMSEMAATAQALHLAVSTVVAFQIVRALTVNSFAVHVWTGLSRIGFFTRLEKLFGKSVGST